MKWDRDEFVGFCAFLAVIIWLVLVIMRYNSYGFWSACGAAFFYAVIEIICLLVIDCIVVNKKEN